MIEVKVEWARYCDCFRFDIDGKKTESFSSNDHNWETMLEGIGMIKPINFLSDQGTFVCTECLK